jgi:DNA-dependent protein kinase catalytic subunit
VGQKGSVFSPREVEQYHYSKGTIIVRLLEFASMVLLKCDQALWKVASHVIRPVE